MNNLIETAFTDFKVNKKSIPVSFLRYEGKATTYITYQNVSIDGSLNGDDELIGYFDYYDFDIYSKGNYFAIVREVKRVLEEVGFIWCPSMSSGDMFEDDTGYYHKTLCFKKERMEE